MLSRLPGGNAVAVDADLAVFVVLCLLILVYLARPDIITCRSAFQICALCILLIDAMITSQIHNLLVPSGYQL